MKPPAPAALPVHYLGMHGLGDNIYQRAHVRQAVANGSEIYLTTPWPQLYADLPGVRCVRPNSHLRTQAKNEKQCSRRFSDSNRSLSATSR